MGFEWTEDKVRFMEDAADYGNYYQNLAAILHPYLQPTDLLCDAGCGLGRLSLELAADVQQITAADLSPLPLLSLEHCRQKRNIRNIRTLCGDIRETLSECGGFDKMLFVFFGCSEEILRISRRFCTGRVMVCKNNSATHRFSRGNYPIGKDNAAFMHTLLEQKKIPCSYETFSLESGQPFRSLADARKFFACYSRDPDLSVFTDDYLKDILIPTKNETFPFYLPKKRELGLLTFLASDIPEDM